MAGGLDLDGKGSNSSNISEEKGLYEEKKETNSLGCDPNDPGEACNSYEWSSTFCAIMTIAILVWCAMAALMFVRKKTNISGMDRLYLLLGLCSIVQFGPILAFALHSGHGFFHYSQTGCKMNFYTKYGTRHTITFLVLSLYAYAQVGLRHGFESVERKIKDNFGWFIVLVAAVECVFGIAPAMYVDVFPYKTGTDWDNTCIFTMSMQLNISKMRAMEVVERAWTPYVIPCLALVCVEVVFFFLSSDLLRLTRNIAEKGRKCKLLNILVCVTTYFTLSVPYAIVLIVEYYEFTVKDEYDNCAKLAICKAKWFFTLVHQLWFLIAPIVYIFTELGGSSLIPDKLMDISILPYKNRVRVVRNGVPAGPIQVHPAQNGHTNSLQNPQTQNPPSHEFTNNLSF